MYLSELTEEFVQIEKFEFTSCPLWFPLCKSVSLASFPKACPTPQSSGGDTQTDETPLYMEIHRRAPLLAQKYNHDLQRNTTGRNLTQNAETQEDSRETQQSVLFA